MSAATSTSYSAVEAKAHCDEVGLYFGAHSAAATFSVEQARVLRDSLAVAIHEAERYEAQLRYTTPPTIRACVETAIALGGKVRVKRASGCVQVIAPERATAPRDGVQYDRSFVASWDTIIGAEPVG